MDPNGYLIEDTEMTIMEDQDPTQEQYDNRQMTREEYEAALAANRPTESILEWFDRAVESELEKHRMRANLQGETIALSQGLGHPSVLEGAASGVEIICGLEGTPDSELADAVEKFAKAEAIIAFEGAVRAAEEAASNAPPEYAEEAAAAGARGYQAELTGVVRNQISGSKPIEVVGYVGITKPHKPRYSKRHFE